MVMVLVKSSTVCVFLVFLSAAWLSTARLNPADTMANDYHKRVKNAVAQVDESSAIKGSIATSTTSKAMVKSLAAIEENLKKLNAKQVVRKLGNAKSASNVQGNRSVRSRLSDEVERGLVAFTADYHRPMHHPPKNN